MTDTALEMLDTPAGMLHVIVDHTAVDASDHELKDLVERVVEAGGRFIQYRAKSESAEEQFLQAVELSEVVHRAGGRLVINGRADVAVAADADGVHLPADGLPVSEARRICGEHAIVGVSTHDLDELRAAHYDGADYTTFSPVWSPISKEDDRTTHGREGLERAVNSLKEWGSELVVYGLGGVTPERAEICASVGAGAATLGAVVRADEPSDVVSSLLSSLSTRP